MKNRILTVVIFGLLPFFSDHARAQQSYSEKSSVSFNRSDIVLTFDLKTTLADGKPYQTVGRVYITGNDEDQEESRVHRIVTDRSGGVYFGYDLVIKPSVTSGRHLVSVRSLSKKPSELTLLGGVEYDSAGQLSQNFTAQKLPKYPEDMTVEDGDTIALDILHNPKTEARIVDYIKVTARKQVIAKKPQDFTPSAVKLRLTSPKLLINGTVSSLLGSSWDGIIDGSIIHVYVPGKGRFIFSLFPQDGFNFQKSAAIDGSKLSFGSNGERYEIISTAPITISGSWNLWVLHDTDYRPDIIFNEAAAGYIEYGASSDVESILKQEWRRKRRILPIRSAESTEVFYQNWLGEVRYIISVEERNEFSRLTTTVERERFITSFWRRRDPEPETEENEFRRDFYNRVSYANQNFAFGVTAGWLTDRGRILITHGRPDDIRKTLTGEIWTYNALPGVGVDGKFEFVDLSKNGNFRLRQ